MTHKTTFTSTIVLIPAYEPGPALLATTKQLVAADFTVVVVDDGSPEAFDPIFHKLSKRVHVVRHTVNKGKGAALKTGYTYIRDTFTNYIVITADADGQHHVADIKKMAESYDV